jgi:Na+-driven multidrug efflux pump
VLQSIDRAVQYAGDGNGQAAAALVGQSLGAKRPEEAKLTVRMALLSVFVFLMVTMTFSFFFGNHFTRFLWMIRKSSATAPAVPGRVRFGGLLRYVHGV